MALKKRGKFPDVVKNTQTFKARVVTVLANEAKNHYLKGFERGGYQTDASKSGWANRKNDRGSTKAILVKRGHLRRSIDVRRATFDRIIIGTLDIPYAEYHNEGTQFGLPKREFLGKSTVLITALRKLIVKELQNAYK